MTTIKGLNHITLACTNIEKSFAFYKDVLGF
ncbi:MAG: glutathione transferase, partial [Alphaproteobacteria bacterium]|nr:glutathione transferase [Alphaproteobacteria bacterium]